MDHTIYEQLTISSKYATTCTMVEFDSDPVIWLFHDSQGKHWEKASWMILETAGPALRDRDILHLY